MKSKNVEKAVQRYAKVKCLITASGAKNYIARLGFKEITWLVCSFETETDEVTLLKVRHINDKDDFQSDYHAGFFFDTIKSAIKEFIGA